MPVGYATMLLPQVCKIWQYFYVITHNKREKRKARELEALVHTGNGRIVIIDFLIDASLALDHPRCRSHALLTDRRSIMI